jgi:hypothetical protein
MITRSLKYLLCGVNITIKVEEAKDMDWTELACDTVQYQAHGNTIMNLRIP